MAVLSGVLGKGVLGAFVLGGALSSQGKSLGPVKIVSIEQPLTPLVVVEQ